MELEQSRTILEENGLQVAAVSYDSTEILAAFAQKHAIRFPLLSDPNSRVIRRFGIFNFNVAPDLRAYGVPHPVEYLVTPDGTVVQKYFVEIYQHRVTGSAVALRQFGTVNPGAPAVTLESGAFGSADRVRFGESVRRPGGQLLRSSRCSPGGTFMGILCRRVLRKQISTLRDRILYGRD